MPTLWEMEQQTKRIEKTMKEHEKTVKEFKKTVKDFQDFLHLWPKELQPLGLNRYTINSNKNKNI